MPVRDLCRRSVVTATTGETVLDAARRMARRDVGTLIVLDGHRVPAGFVTDRDLVLRVLAAGKDPARTTLAAVMEPVVLTADEEDELPQVLRRMREERVRRLAVVDRHGALCGIVALDDVLRQIGDEMAEVARLIASEARLDSPGKEDAS